MAKKRITLVSNFADIVNSGDMAAFQAVFDKCDIRATGAYAKGSALHFCGLTEEMICWLVSRGLSIDVTNTYGRTPLHEMASTRGCKIEVYIKLGADVNARDRYGDTPLHFAAGSGFNSTNAKLLLEYGADPLAKNQYGQTPLEYALSRASNINIESLPEIARLLLTDQTEITEEMQKRVTEIGETFEFYRANFNPDYLVQTETALEELYRIFGVKPVAKRKIHDGTSPIEVAATTWQKQFNELWDLLVPGSGSASTVQGEVIRICGKVAGEILDNGGANWSRGYKKLPQALPVYCAMGNRLNSSDYDELQRLANGILANSGEEELDRLTELAVKWVMINPNPIALTMVSYDR